MRTTSRFMAAALAVVVWLFAGLSVASGTLVPKAITSSSLDATATSWIPGID